MFDTNAFDMVINFPDVRMVINYGPPRDMVEFIQEIGRSGRDGKPAQAHSSLHWTSFEKL